MVPTKMRLLMVSALMAVLPMSCGRFWRATEGPPAPADPVERTAVDAAVELDQVAADLEQYGTISASAAPLIRDPHGMFAVRLPMSAAEMFAYNQQVEGSSVQTDVQSESIQGRFGYEETPARATSARSGARSGGARSGTGQAADGSSRGGLSGRGGPAYGGDGVRAGAGGGRTGGPSAGGRGTGVAPGRGTADASAEVAPSGARGGRGGRSGNADDSASDTLRGEPPDTSAAAAPREAGTDAAVTPDLANEADDVTRGEMPAPDRGSRGGRGGGAGITGADADRAGGAGRSGGSHAGASEARSEDSAILRQAEELPEPVVILPAPLPRRSPASYALRLSDLINLTANDYVRKQVLEWTSDPDLASLGENKVLLAAILTVSIRPGSRTAHGYIAELDVRTQYARKQGDEIVAAPATHHPLAFAVFPGMDSQVLDLQASKERQQAISLLAQASATEAAGAVRADLFRLLQHDIGTLSAVNTVVGYNMSGRHFGWHFQPRVTAQADPTSLKSGPGYILQPQSFPALVFILMDKDDLPPALGGTAGAPVAAPDAVRGMHSDLGPLGTILSAGATPESASGSPAAAAPGYDHIIFRFSTRWVPVDPPNARKTRLVLPWSSGPSDPPPRFSEQRMVEWACRLASVREKLQDVKCQCGMTTTPNQAKSEGIKSPDYYAPLIRTLENRLYVLEAATIGTDVAWAIPEPAASRPAAQTAPPSGRSAATPPRPR